MTEASGHQLWGLWNSSEEKCFPGQGSTRGSHGQVSGGGEYRLQDASKVGKRNKAPGEEWVAWGTSLPWWYMLGLSMIRSSKDNLRAT